MIRRSNTHLGGVSFETFEVLGVPCLAVRTPEQLEAFLSEARNAPLLALDTETTGLRWYLEDEIAGVSMAWRTGDTVVTGYMPCRHETSDSVTIGNLTKEIPTPDLSKGSLKLRREKKARYNYDLMLQSLYQSGVTNVQIDSKLLFSKLREFFNTTSSPIWLHNAKFDLAMFRKEEVLFEEDRIRDTVALWHLFDSEASKSLKDIMAGWFDRNSGIQKQGLIGPDASLLESLVKRAREHEKAAKLVAKKQRIAELCADPSFLLLHQGLKKRALTSKAAEAVGGQNYSLDDIKYSMVPIELMVPYAALDTYFTLFLYEYVTANLVMGKELQSLFDNDMRVIHMLLQAEKDGICVDRKYLAELETTLQGTSDSLDAEIRSLLHLGADANPNSDAQLLSALQGFGLRFTKLTETGKLSLDADVLTEKIDEHPAIPKILSYRTTNKLLGTYVKSMLHSTTGDVGTIHCTFNPLVATGRMSSKDPNLQNIPGRVDYIRKAFVPPNEDYVYLFADYSQVEVRITAHYSSDKTLLTSYRTGMDAHINTASVMFGVPYQEMVDVRKAGDKSDPLYKEYSAYRDAAKTINFAIIYGVSPQGLSTKIPRPERYRSVSTDEWIKACGEFMEIYLDKLPGVAKFVRDTERLVAERGVVYNYFGRPRRLPHVWNKKLESRAKRQAVNFLVQSTAADIFKFSAVKVADLLKGKKSYLCNFVHDEVQIYLHKDEFHLLNPIREALEGWNLKVPLLAEFAWSTDSWGDKKELG